MLYPVILAGGSGTRLWPLSTKANPKQINYLLNNQSLLQATYQRLLTGFASEQIFLVTNRELAPVIQDQLKISTQNMMIEPNARNTAAAIGFAAVKLLVHDKQAVMVTINSDAYVQQVDQYLAAIHQAGQLATQAPDHFFMLGIKPLYPETGYGYIKSGQIIGDIGVWPVYAVDSFKEKPDLATAEEYCQSKEYLWNPAIFVFSAQSLLDWYKIHLPELWQSLQVIYSSLLSESTEESEKTIEREYSTIQSISIDYGLLEKLDNMRVLPVDITWADIGHWRSLRDVQLEDKQQENITRGKYVGIDSRRNLLYAENKLIATVGVEDMILVETERVIFLCPAARAHEVKDLLAKLKEKGLEDYL